MQTKHSGRSMATGPISGFNGDEKFIHFTFETTRAGQVSRDVLGPDFCGTLVTDCYCGYNAQVAGVKQKCLAHLARTPRDWQKLVELGSVDHQFFEDIKQFVKRGCRFHRKRKERKLKPAAIQSEIVWLRSELERLSLTEVSGEKSITLQGRLLRHLSEWLVFLDDVRVPPTNNLAERALRPLAVLRYLKFGSRTFDGGQRMADLMSVAETARRHGHHASDIFYKLYTRPPNKVLREMYASTYPASASSISATRSTNADKLSCLPNASSKRHSPYITGAMALNAARLNNNAANQSTTFCQRVVKNYPANYSPENRTGARKWGQGTKLLLTLTHRLLPPSPY